ncbi:Ribonuclease H-like domain [Phytophthora cactorum]|nr:Ribonuclease H-like domain [Phytophthora cactorum]
MEDWTDYRAISYLELLRLILDAALPRHGPRAWHMANNIAEYGGLLHGLKYAKRSGLHSLHVVGDSQMIIRQNNCRKPPQAQHLAKLYWHCRILADLCNMQAWTHHYRVRNKTADSLANIAMDATRSCQVIVSATSSTGSG